MAQFAFPVELNAKPGKESECEASLNKEAALVRQEPGTLSWHAAKDEAEPGLFIIFDSFDNEADREAHHPKGRGLIYAASSMPAAGESANDCLERFPGGDFAASVHLTSYTLPGGTSGSYALVQADKYAALLVAGVPLSQPHSRP